MRAPTPTRKAFSASEALSVDTLGYVTADPIPPPASFAIAPAAPVDAAALPQKPWQSAPQDLGLRGGSLHTAFVLTGSGDDAFEVLWCADTTTSGDQTECRRVAGR
jgi:hypothetical protein